MLGLDIQCAKCKKQVDLVTTVHDMDSMVTLIVVECHGDRESVSLPDHMLIDIRDMSDVTFTEAFANEKMCVSLSTSLKAIPPRS